MIFHKPCFFRSGLPSSNKCQLPYFRKVCPIIHMIQMPHKICHFKGQVFRPVPTGLLRFHQVCFFLPFFQCTNTQCILPSDGHLTALHELYIHVHRMFTIKDCGKVLKRTLQMEQLGSKRQKRGYYLQLGVDH